MRLSRKVRYTAFGSALAVSVFGAPVVLGAQAIEIIVGGQTRVLRGPGVRAIAHVSPDLSQTRVEAAHPLSSSEVLLVQTALDAHGFDSGPHDGLMGPRVNDAIDAFRAMRGWPRCGCLDGSTLAALGIRARVVQTFVGTSANDPPIEIIRPTRRIGGAVGGRVIETAEPEGDAPAADADGTVPGVPYIPILRPANRRSEAAARPPSGGRRLGSGSGRLGRTRPPPGSPPR